MSKLRITTLLLLGIAMSAFYAVPAGAAVTPQIDTGKDFTCALLPSGAVKCWGAGGDGQLGNGSFNNSLIPVPVVGVTDATDLSVGERHACAVHNGGALVCWGSSQSGVLGNGLGVDTAVPVPVTGLGSGVTVVDAGGNSTCAVHNASAKCWGSNSDKQLGDGTNTPSTTPVSVNDMATGVTDVAAGSYHSCAVKNGAAWCWGDDDSGALGNAGGEDPDTGTPVQVWGLVSGVTEIAGSDRATCAVHNGAAKCWGLDSYGKLGNGAPGSADVPAQVLGLNSGVTHVDAIADHACALMGGLVYCWGDGKYGKLGVIMGSATEPQLVGTAPAPAVDVSAGVDTTCSITTVSASCWGMNDAGQTGNGVSSGSSTPQDVSGIASGATAVSTGGEHTCAIVSDAAKCWGEGGSGGLGYGSFNDSYAPVGVVGLTSGVTEISVGSKHSCAVHAAAAKCWGYDVEGALGDGAGNSSSNAPVTVSGVTPDGAGRLGSGTRHTCAVHDTGPDNVFKCWGRGIEGQLGNGFIATEFSPVTVSGIAAHAQRIDGGPSGTCAIVGSLGMTAKCWGEGTYGALGNNDSSDSSTPVDVDSSLGTGLSDIAVGELFGCAVTSSAVMCWGLGSDGQLGTGSTTSFDTPQQVSDLTSGVTDVDAGDKHACAVVAGQVKCWGDNYEGQLGNGTNTSSLTPVTVSGISNATAVSAGAGNTCARLATGTIKCWGDGYYGAIGSGINPSLSTPTVVASLDLSTPAAPVPGAPGVTKGALAPKYKVGKIKKRLGRHWTPVTITTPVPSGLGQQLACSGRATGKLVVGRKKVKATFGALTRSGVSSCKAKATFKLKRLPAKRKKYKLTLTFPGNDAFNPYKGSKKLVLRR